MFFTCFFGGCQPKSHAYYVDHDESDAVDESRATAACKSLFWFRLQVHDMLKDEGYCVTC